MIKKRQKYDDFDDTRTTKDMAFMEPLPEHLAAYVLGICILSLTCYVIHQRYFHPLARYPGPLWASLTDLWQVRQFLTLQQPYALTRLHEKYGPVVRYGPDKISITSESAVPVIYQKGAKNMPKTEFYDAYGGRFPNVFGMRNEDVRLWPLLSHCLWLMLIPFWQEHSIRRRHMSHSFSLSYVKEMEVWLDLNIKILRQNIARHAAAGLPFDLRQLLHYYVIDTLGELAFSQSFGLQESCDPDSLVPPVVEHSLLAAATGAWPSMTATLKKWLPYVPSRSLKKLFAGRQAVINLANHCVQRRLEDLRDIKDDEDIRRQRKDILTNLILAKHPDSGERLTPTDLETEAFGFM